MLQIKSVFSDVHWLPGVMPVNTLRDPDIANAFIFERDGRAYLIDTGVGKAFREALSGFFANREYRSFTLINTHCHVDHKSVKFRRIWRVNSKNT